MSTAMSRVKSVFSIAYVATWIGMFVVIFNVALGALENTTMLQWLPNGQTGVGYLIDSKQRVDSAQQAYSSGAVKADRYLGAVVGISNVREGISLERLGKTLGPRWRFIGIAGAGAGAPSIAEQADLLLQSELRPDLVVLGISPLHLLDSLVDPVRSRAISENAPQPGAIEQAKNAVRQVAWLVGRRNDVRAWWDRQLMDWRTAVQTSIDINTSRVDPRGPWRPMLRTLAETSPSKATIDSGLSWARSFSAGSLTTYNESFIGPQVAARMINNFHVRGACVVVVMMPERSQLRALEPPRIAAISAKRLRTDSGIPELIILDLRAGLEDRYFIDLVHLNAKGSEALASLLGASIIEINMNRPPLMKLQSAPVNRRLHCT